MTSERIDRREFLLYALAAGTSFVGLVFCMPPVINTAVGLLNYYSNQRMVKPPDKEGHILVDLHAHPGKNYSQDEILRMLSWGVTGLTQMNGQDGILTYEDALKLPGVTQINEGLLARIDTDYGTGYFVKMQEVSSDHDILAIGCRGTIKDYQDAKETIYEIHNRGGKAFLPHPYVVGSKDVRKYRLTTDDEQPWIEELYKMCDGIEGFNAQNINLFPLIAWMRVANDRAKILAKKYGKNHIAVSDAHYLPEQVKVSGTYVPTYALRSIDELVGYLTSSTNIENYEQYVTPRSFIRGMFFHN